MMTTERLILSEVTKHPMHHLCLELVNTEGWLTNIGDKNIHDIAAAEKYIAESYTKSYRENGYGFYKFSLKESNTPIGISGLVNRPTLDHVDIGFAIHPNHAGKGYAFEATNAVLQFAQDQLKLSPILGITLPSNKRSQLLLEKLGLSFVKQLPPNENNERLLLYST